MKLNERLFSKKFFIFNLVLLGTLFGFSLAFVSFSCSTGGAKNTIHAESPSANIPTDSLAVAESLQTAFRSISDKVLPSVVEIKVVEIKKQQVPQMDGIPWEFFFGTPPDQNGNNNQQEYRSQGLGSGIIVQKNGNTYYVLTNNHVAGDASEISVAMNDGREFPAKLVGKDKRKDLAVVSFQSSENFPLATLGDSDTVRVGDWAIAVGNPLGLMSSVTMGIVSAVGRTGGPAGNINDFIQTDAAINQGNSGGALVNIRGEVVGINTWIASPSGGSVGLGFAIPINNAKNAMNELIKTGQVKYGWLGVSLVDGDKDIMKDLKVPENQKGALASQIFLGSPAEKGGMLPGDYIIKLNGKDVHSRDQLVLAVGDLKAGEKATFEVLREGQKKTIEVRIDERKDDVAAENAKLWPGLIVVPLTEDVRKTLNLDASAKGLYVAEVIAKSPASVVGVQRGDLVVSVNGKTVNNLLGFYRALNDTNSKDLYFEVQRGDQKLETMKFKK
jgi:Do/DeqQ family serine protease